MRRPSLPPIPARGEPLRPVAGVSSRLLTTAVRQVEARWQKHEGDGADRGDLARLLAAFALAADQGDPRYVDELIPRPSLRLSQHLLDWLEEELLACWRGGQASGTQVLSGITALRRVRGSIERRYQRHPGAPLLGPDGIEYLVEFVHDLRSPLNSVLFLAETLQQGRSGPVNELQRRQLGLIYSAALALSSVANNTLTLARERDQLEESAPGAFSIVELLEGVHDIVRPMVEEKGLTVHLVPPATDLRLGHPLELSSTLLNLATNALKFTERGYVEIRAQEGAGHRVEFSVRDTGGGINPAARETLFEPFRRGTGERRYAFSSTGLGLAIARRLVAAMGGRLDFETTPGEGTRFYFDLELPPA